MKGPKSTSIVSMPLDASIVERIDELAKSESRTRAGLIRVLINEAIESRMKKAAREKKRAMTAA